MVESDEAALSGQVHAAQQVQVARVFAQPVTERLANHGDSGSGRVGAGLILRLTDLANFPTSART